MGFEVRSQIPGVEPETARALGEIQTAIAAELKKNEERATRPRRRVRELVEEGHVIAKPGEVVRVQPGDDDITVYLPENAANNSGQDIVVSFEGDGTAVGKVIVASMGGTCALPGVTTLNSPGQYRYTSIGETSAKPGVGSPTPSTSAGGSWSGPPPVTADDLPLNGVTNPILADMAQATIKGRAEGAGTGDPTDLTATQIASIIDGETVTWTGNHTFSGQLLLGTSQVVSSAPPLNITLGANVSRLFLTSGTAGDIQTISGSTAGRIVYVQNVFGSKTVKHSTGTTSALVCPNNADFSVIPRDTFWLIGDGSNGWLVSSTPPQLRRLPGAPIYDVMAPPFNAAGNGSTDDTTAINAAIAAANATPGDIYLGPAHKVTAALTAITGHNIRIIGRGEFNGGTKVTVDSASAIDLFTFSACQYGAIIGVWITSARIYSSGWAVVVSGTIHFRMHRVRIQEVCFGVKIENALLTYIDQCEISDISGNRGFLAQGTGGGFNHEAIFHRCTVGTQYPGDIIGTPAAWATGHAYIVGNVVYANGNIYQCVQSGTSSGAGSGPSGIPGTTPATSHTTQITDNTVRWVYAMGLFVGFYHGSFAHTFQLNNCTVLQGGYGLVVEDSAPGAGSLPQFTRAVNFQCDHTLLRGVQLLGGHKARFHHTFITSILAGTGIEVSSTFGGDWEFVGGEVFGCSQAGVIVNCGDGELADLQIGACGGISSNTRDCIEVGNSASDWSVTDCSGGVMFTAATDTRYGISIAAGCDNYLVEDNRFLGNVTGPILNTPGQATTRMVRNNIPEEAVTYSAAQTFASQILLGTSQVLSSAPPHTVTLNADATRLFFTTGTPGTLQTVSGSTAGRVVYVQPVFAALTVQHTAAGVGSIVCPGNVSFVCRARDGFFLIGDGTSNGWLVAGAPVGLVFDGDKGDVTVSASGSTWTIDNDVVTNAKAANMAQSTIKGRAEAAGTGDPTDLTPTQVVAIIDAESPTWTASHRFDSFVQFGNATGLPGTGDIRKGTAATFLVNTGSSQQYTSGAGINMDGSTLNLTGSTAVNITANTTDVALIAADQIDVTAENGVILNRSPISSKGGTVRFEAASVLGTPPSGQVALSGVSAAVPYLAYSTAALAERVGFTANAGSIQSANAAQTNSTTNITVTTVAPNANAWAVDTVYKLQGFFTFLHTAAATPTITVEVLIQGVVAQTVECTPAASAGTYGGRVEATIVCRTTGAGGTAMVTLLLLTDCGTNLGNTVMCSHDNTPSALDTTSAATLLLRVRMTTAVASNTLTVIEGFATRLA